MIRKVSLLESTYREPPLRFEAGTPAIAETAGLSAAIDYLERIGMAQIRAHEEELVSYAFGILGEIPELTIFGPRDPAKKGGVFSFQVGEIHAHDMAQFLDSQGIAVRAGHHCAQPLMEWLGLPATARATFYLYTIKEEIDALAEAIRKAKAFFSC